MLNLIVERNNIDQEYPRYSSLLESDLELIRLLDLPNKPEINTLKVKVYMNGEPRTLFYILQYGVKNKGNFEPSGEEVRYTTKDLISQCFS